MDKKVYSSINNTLKDKRSRIREMFFFGAVAGICMAVFSFYLGEFLKQHYWPFSSADGNMIFWGMGLLSIVGLLCGKIMVRDNREDDSFRLLFPLQADATGKMLTTRKIQGYAVPSYVEKILRQVCQHNSDEAADLVVLLFGGKRRPKGVDKKEKLNAVLHKTVFILLLNLIKQYSEKTLTKTCAYLPEYQHLCWPCDCDNCINPCHDSTITQHVPKKIVLPPSFRLSFPRKGKGRRADIRLEDDYVRLDFRLPEHWARITRKNSRRTYKTATRFMDDKDSLCLIYLGLRLTLRLKWRAMVTRKAVDRSCGWLAGLMADTRRWLSWEHYQQNDMERMLVDLHQCFIQSPGKTAGDEETSG